VIKAPKNNKKAKTFPNAFIAYKKALIKENRNRNIKLPSMRQLSKIASCYWKEEPENVKAFYSKLSEDAKSLYKLENPIQILFDKNMNEVEVSRVINKADSNYVNYIQGNEDPVENMQNSTIGYLPIEDNSASVMNFFLDNNYINRSQASFPNSNFFEDPYLMNQVPNDQVYIKKLECENVQFPPLHVDSDYTQGFEYGMDHIFTDFVSVENNLKNVSAYGTDSNYINNGTGEALPVENMNMYLFEDQ
ncbi:2914_t:CDS:2, partial [Funneliformis mosseae]